MNDAARIAEAALEIDDQNRRMTGLVVSLAGGALSAVAITMIWIL